MTSNMSEQQLKRLNSYACYFSCQRSLFICLQGRGSETYVGERSELTDVQSLATKAYRSLLGLSFLVEVANVWTEDNFNVYCTEIPDKGDVGKSAFIIQTAPPLLSVKHRCMGIANQFRYFYLCTKTHHMNMMNMLFGYLYPLLFFNES